MQTKEGKDYLMYAKARNQAKSACRKAVKDYEKDIAKKVKTNPKAFYAYAKTKMRTQEGIADLRDSSGVSATTDSGKAEMLNRFFCSVFTREDLQTLPECARKDFSVELHDIHIETNTVLKLKITRCVSQQAQMLCILGFYKSLQRLLRIQWQLCLKSLLTLVLFSCCRSHLERI